MLLEDEMNVPGASACGTELGESRAHVPPSPEEDKVSSVSTEETQVLSEILEVPNEMTMDMDVGEDTQAVLDVPVYPGNSMETLVGKHILERVLESRLPVDTVIICSDGKIGAHRLVLAAASPFLGLLFEDQKLGEVAVLFLPDLKKAIVEILLNIAYTGVMVFPPEKEEEVFEAMELLLFCHKGNLEMNMVTVKIPQPEIPIVPVAGSSRAISDHQAIDSETRKRALAGTSGERKLKKTKYDENGNRIQKALRTGVSVGKQEMVKFRRREERRIIENANNICKPPFLCSDLTTKTVRFNVRKMPFTSIRLTQITDLVCLELPTRNEWSAGSTTTELNVEDEAENNMDVFPNPEQEQANLLPDSKGEEDLTESLTLPGLEVDRSSGINSNEEVESELTDVLPCSNLDLPDAGSSSILKETENEDSYSYSSNLPCSEIERMDLALPPKQRIRRNSEGSSHSSRSSCPKSTLEIDPHEVLELIPT